MCICACLGIQRFFFSPLVIFQMNSLCAKKIRINREYFFSKLVASKSSALHLAFHVPVSGLEEGFQASLAPYPAVKALICLPTIMLMQLGLTLLTSAVFFFLFLFFFFFQLKDRRLPCDPSLFLSNDTQPWLG